MSPYQYIKRALFIIALLFVALLIIRPFFVPQSFGLYGDYRGDHMDEERARDPVHSGNEVCGECHEDNFEIKSRGMHAPLSCETCHFQPYALIEDRKNGHPEISNAPDRSRRACLTCHEFLPSRPENFPQLKDFRNHIKTNLSKVKTNGQADIDTQALCINCHNPHSPKIPAEEP